MVFDCEGIIFQHFPVHFKTLEASNIEPGSWFCTLTPQFTVQQIVTDDISGSSGSGRSEIVIVPPQQERQGQMNLHSKAYNRDGDGIIYRDKAHSNSNTNSNSNRNSNANPDTVLIDGYKSYVYLENVLSPVRIMQERSVWLVGCFILYIHITIHILPYLHISLYQSLTIYLTNYLTICLSCIE